MYTNLNMACLTGEKLNRLCHSHNAALSSAQECQESHIFIILSAQRLATKINIILLQAKPQNCTTRARMTSNIFNIFSIVKCCARVLLDIRQQFRELHHNHVHGNYKKEKFDEKVVYVTFHWNIEGKAVTGLRRSSWPTPYVYKVRYRLEVFVSADQCWQDS